MFNRYPPGIQRPSEMMAVFVTDTDPETYTFLALPHFEELRASQPVFTDVAGSLPFWVSLGRPGGDQFPADDQHPEIVARDEALDQDVRADFAGCGPCRFLLFPTGTVTKTVPKNNPSAHSSTGCEHATHSRSIPLPDRGQAAMLTASHVRRDRV